MTTWQWMKATPRWLLLAGAVSVTWGLWLAHVYGAHLERRHWEKLRVATEQHCVRPPESFKGDI